MGRKMVFTLTAALLLLSAAPAVAAEIAPVPAVDVTLDSEETNLFEVAIEASDTATLAMFVEAEGLPSGCVATPNPETLDPGLTLVEVRLNGCDFEGVEAINILVESDTELAMVLNVAITPPTLWMELLVWPGAFALIVAFVWWAIRFQTIVDELPGAERHVKLGTEAAWDFKTSWGTNVTAIGAILGIVAGATGLLEAIIPGNGAVITAASVVYLGIGLVAPIVYLIYREQSQHPTGRLRMTTPYGTLKGLLNGARVTLHAVVGQLATLGAVVWFADLRGEVKAALLVLVVVGFAWILAYATRSTGQLARAAYVTHKPTKRPTTVAALQGIERAIRGEADDVRRPSEDEIVIDLTAVEAQPLL